MKVLAVLTFVALIATFTVAEEVHVKAIKAKENPIMKLTGGYIQRPGVRQGKVTFLNAQKSVPTPEFVPLAKKLAKILHISFDVRDVDLPDGFKGCDSAFKKDGADFAVFIIDNLQCDNSLTILPEKHYAIVNVNTLRTNGGEGAFLVSRAKKQVARAFFFVAGGASSSSEGNLMSAFPTLKDLDKIPTDAIPIEVIGRIGDYLPRMGCETRAIVTYKKACQEGWAPPPTNDYQKAIWDKVHKIPDKPIKIEFDPKKDK